MGMRNDRLRKLLWIGAIGSIVLAFLLIIVTILVPLMLGGSLGGTNTPADMIKSTIPVISFLLIILGGLGFFALTIYYIAEIATAGNNTTWKVIWIIAVLVIGALGMLIYERVARGDLR